MESSDDWYPLPCLFAACLILGGNKAFVLEKTQLNHWMQPLKKNNIEKDSEEPPEKSAGTTVRLWQYLLSP